MILTTEQIEVGAKVLAPIVSLIVAGVLKQIIEPRSRLISYMGHVSVYRREGQPDLNAHNVIVRNIGRKAATNVRIGHVIFPASVTLYPHSIAYQIVTNTQGMTEIVIPVLVPKEEVTISYLYDPPVNAAQINTYTKYDERFARIIRVIPTPQPPIYVTVLVWFFAIVGMGFAAYWLLLLIAHVLLAR